MEAAKTSLALPLKTHFFLSVFSTVTYAAIRRDDTIDRRILKLIELRVPPTSNPTNSVKSHDVTVDPTRDLWFRVYVPTHVTQDIPVIVYFHGGGFAFLSPDIDYFDAMYQRIARKVHAVVVSVNYRLAPEHRYPAQHEDCFDVLKFFDDEENRSKSLPENANISWCFLAGDSAGGNLAHHVTQRACESGFQQLKVIGVVAILPFFGGEERTISEKELQGNNILSLHRTDWYWKVFMPPSEGYNRDHPIINVSGPQAVDISKIDFPATLVVVTGFDVLRDWQIRYYEWLKKSGKEAYLVDYPNMCHSFYVFPELPECEELVSEVKDFINKVLKKAAN